MKKIAALAAIVLAVVLLLAACGDDLEGTWETTTTELGMTITETYKFDDGKYTLTLGGLSAEGTYKTDGDKLIMTSTGESITLTYKVTGKTLTITYLNGDTITFTKK